MDVVQKWRANEPAQMKAAAMMAAWGFSQEQTLDARARVLELVEREPGVMLAACDMIEQFATRGTIIGSTLGPDSCAAELAVAVANYAIAISRAEHGIEIEQRERPVRLLARLDINGESGVSEPEQASVGECMRGWGFADDDIRIALDMLLQRCPTPPEVSNVVEHLITNSWDLGESERRLMVGAVRTSDERNVRRAETLANCIVALAAVRSGVESSKRPFSVLGLWEVLHE